MIMISLRSFELVCGRLRHLPLLRSLVPIWNALRPIYSRLLRMAGSHGLERNMNGTDPLRLDVRCREVGDAFEPHVWSQVMPFVRPGCGVIDVGAHWGVYAVAFGLRTGNNGRVLAVEPDPASANLLRSNIALNQLTRVVTIVQAALGEDLGAGRWSVKGYQSQLSDDGELVVEMTTLDAITGNDSFEVMMIDVEGHEEKVLSGGRRFLSDAKRRPKAIMVEVHPYAWAELGSSSKSLLAEVRQHGYEVRYLDGSEIVEIKNYGHMLALLP